MKTIGIIGAGAVGLAIAYQLTESNYQVEIFEKETPGSGQSTRNSAVIHAGIMFEPKTLKGRCFPEAYERLYAFGRKHNVPMQAVGKIFVHTDEGDDADLDTYVSRAKEMGVDYEELTREQIKKREPNVESKRGVFFPATGVLNTRAYIRTLETLVKSKGAKVHTAARVTGMQKTPEGGLTIEYQTPDGMKTTTFDAAVNSAGLYSGEVSKMISPGIAREIVPIRGEYYVFTPNRPEIAYNSTNIYPVSRIVQSEQGMVWKNLIHLTPRMDENGKLMSEVLVGPRLELVRPEERENYGGERMTREQFITDTKKYFPGLKAEDLTLGHVGVMINVKNTPDFQFDRDPAHQNLIHLQGMSSPALTASLKIGEMVVNMLEEKWKPETK